MKIKKSNVFFVLIYVLVTLSSCNLVDKEIECITLSSTEVHLEAGEVHQLSADITPEEATDKEITWFSSNENVATIKNGSIYAISDGNAKITAKAKNGVTSDICWVFVSTKTEFDKLNTETKPIYYVLTDSNVLYDYFKDPSSVEIRDVQEIVFKNTDGEERTHGSFYAMSIAGTNGFGGTTIDTYVVSRNYVFTFDEFLIWMESNGETFLRTSTIDNLNLDSLNRALQEYFEEKGW